MPVIQQQTLPIGGANLSTTQGFSVSNSPTPSSFPITSVQTSAATPSSVVAASGVSDSQVATARKVSTSAFLSASEAPIQPSKQASKQKATAFDASSMNRSVTAKARVTTPTDGSISLSDHTHLPTDVRHIATCLKDHSTQSTETTTHKLINVCTNGTEVEGYIEPKCNVNQPKENQINAFKLKKIGDMYTAETKKNKDCKQPILASPAPEKIGECFYVTTTSYYEINAYNRTVVNACDKAVKGHLEKECLAVGELTEPWGRFTLEKQGDTRLFVTEDYCKSPIREGDRPNPPTRAFGCIDHYVTKNGNGTTTVTVGNGCERTIHPFIEKGCTATPPPLDNEWNRFSLAPGSNYTVLLHDKLECDQPFHHKGEPEEPKEPIGYAKHYCPPKASLSNVLSPTVTSPNAPKAGKIIGGENVSTLDARHLVHVINSELGHCTGSLISDRHVLTAAHCVRDTGRSFRPSYIDRIVVRHDPYPKKNGHEPQFIPTTEYRVKAGHIAPDYTLERHFTSCDLAILELTKPVVNGKSVPLPTKEDFCEFTQAIDEVLKTDFSYSEDRLSGNYDKNQLVWEKGNVVYQGFGREKNRDNRLHDANRAKQERVVAYKLNNNDKTVVSQRRNNGGVTCLGDSGGPLLFETKDKRKVQVGVHSAVKPSKIDCDLIMPLYATNVYEKSHRQWIQARLAENSDTAVIQPQDLTRLRVSPDSCVYKIDQPDGFASRFGTWFFIQGSRRIAFTNNCHNKNHPSKVNIKFYSVKGKTQNLEIVAEGTKQEKVPEIELGETKVFYTDGSKVEITLSWSDVDDAVGVNPNSADNVKNVKLGQNNG